VGEYYGLGLDAEGATRWSAEHPTLPWKSQTETYHCMLMSLFMNSMPSIHVFCMCSKVCSWLEIMVIEAEMETASCLA